LEINNAIASRLEMREFIKAVSDSLRDRTPAYQSADEGG